MIDIKRLVRSFNYALEGIVFVLRKDQNMRIHLGVAIVVLVLGLLFGITPFELGLLLVAIAFVLCIEMLNSAIEQMVNLISREHRQEAKIAKDVSAGMVLIAAIASSIIGIYVFAPYILRLLI